jgi:hypothetical protein
MWLTGRFVSANWDVEEIMSKQKEIVDNNLLKWKMSLA